MNNPLCDWLAPPHVDSADLDAPDIVDAPCELPTGHPGPHITCNDKCEWEGFSEPAVHTPDDVCNPKNPGDS